MPETKAVNEEPTNEEKRWAEEPDEDERDNTVRLAELRDEAKSRVWA